MLRYRSRTVTSKQTIMTDHSSQSPSTQNYTHPIPSFFASPSFKGFTFKRSSESEAVISPTSILEPLFSPVKNPFRLDTSQPNFPNENKHSWRKLNTKGIGVALIDDEEKLDEQNSNNSSFSNPGNRMVLFGTKLRVQVQPPADFAADFGIKTRNSQLSGSGSANSGMKMKESPGLLTGCVSMSDLEMSEDYTCVISYGPNPKTTHIFDNCVLENYTACDSSRKNFLSFCHTCKKSLQQKNDIFIYRGERAFCSQECRNQEMLLDELEN